MPVHSADAVPVALYRRFGRQGLGNACDRRAVFLCRADDGAHGAAVGHIACVADDIRQPGRAVRAYGHEGFWHIAYEGNAPADCVYRLSCDRGVFLSELCAPCGAGQNVDTALFREAEIT